MKLSLTQKKIVIVAGVAVVGIMIYKAVKKANSETVIGNKTLVSPESTITIGPAKVTPASKSWSIDFADSVGDLVASGWSGSNSGMLK